MNIAYCGFDFFSSCLSELLRQGHRVLKVFSVPGDNKLIYADYVQDICEKNRLPLSFTPIKQEDLKALQEQDCQYLISAAYSHKIPPLEAFGIKGINVHPSLLPQGKGPWPIPWIILKGLHKTGISIHQLTDKFDSGPILLQSEFAVDRQENLESLNAKFQMQALKDLRQVMTDLEGYWRDAQTQVGVGSYWTLPGESDYTLDWRDTAEGLNQRMRAFGKHGCRAHFNEQWWWVFELLAWREDHEMVPGTTVHQTNTETIVSCADGLVCLRYFRPY